MRDAGHIPKTADVLNSHPLSPLSGVVNRTFPPTVHTAREEGCAMTNRFPLPWRVEEQGGCFVVRDNNGQALSNVYFEDQSERHLFTRDEARHIAKNVQSKRHLFTRDEARHIA